MTKCVFTVNDKDVNMKYITNVLNESGTIQPGDNLVIGECQYAEKMNGRNIKSLIAESRSLHMQESVGDNAKTLNINEFYSEYRPLEDHINRLNDLVSKNSSILSLEKLSPSTAENRQLHLYKLGKGNKRKVLISGGIHAREWLSPAVVSYLINFIVNDYKTNGQWKELLENNQYYIIPISNPDGYVYTYKTEERYWRKNRNGNGVDINRNFPVGFGGPGTSKDPNTDIYTGPEPFSEAESQALKKIVDGNDFFMHLDIHAFSQLIAGSWAYKEEPAPDSQILEQNANKMIESMTNSYNYGHGSMNGKLGLSGGSFQDYSNSKGILAYTIELPPASASGLSGFAPDSQLIIPTGNDVVNAISSISFTQSTNSSCMCAEIYQPVCGVDNKTYPNKCNLDCSGIALQHEGACKLGPCSDMKCGLGYKCVEKQVQCVTEPCDNIGVCEKIEILKLFDNNYLKIGLFLLVIIIIIFILIKQ